MNSFIKILFGFFEFDFRNADTETCTVTESGRLEEKFIAVLAEADGNDIAQEGQTMAVQRLAGLCQKTSSHGSGGWKSEGKMLADLVSLKASRLLAWWSHGLSFVCVISPDLFL